MIRATAVLPADSWSAPAVDTIVLDFDDRHRRRIAMTGTGGLAFLLDLPEAVMLRSGDALALEDGRLVEVLSAPEDLVEVRGGDAVALARLAWHIGNRHVPAQILPKAIRLRRDHVIEEMLESLGGRLRPIEAPFDPEGGAYAAAHRGHDQGHHAHDGHKHHGHHDHGHHAHDHRADDKHGHAHGEGREQHDHADGEGHEQHDHAHGEGHGHHDHAHGQEHGHHGHDHHGHAHGHRR